MHGVLLVEVRATRTKKNCTTCTGCEYIDQTDSMGTLPSCTHAHDLVESAYACARAYAYTCWWGALRPALPAAYPSLP